MNNAGASLVKTKFMITPMGSGLHANSKWSGYLVRAVAIFFLFFVVTDIISPQLCSEEAEGLLGASPTNVSAVRDVGRATPSTAGHVDSDRPDQPFERAPHDGDCLGCCAHVLPGSVFVATAALESKSFAAPAKYSQPPSPSLPSTFRPPRLA